ncbi:hydroxypyruvate isomerase family protein [Telmatospirillum sp. J64-1]|uniref:hydroxypyruvate isomerase family protein n=1 Tax=Telmatospirillum sp. J64-1 TaxID=2502183 RepID=UPI00115DAD3D|nr:TIM barrel protein [Telmatospirillum sp. J64-1]
MIRFSANLGFLFTDRPLPEAILAAKAAGFSAVECHWPYDFDPVEIKAALDATGLPMVGINTLRGDLTRGENGLAALSGREEEARSVIRRAVEYAAAIGAANVHVMAGRKGHGAETATFVANLRFAAELAGAHGIGILIEPLNPHDAPDYFLNSIETARAVIETVGAPNLKIMFDCYHQQRLGGELIGTFLRHKDLIGHVQFASAPDRAEPDHGEVDYAWLLPELQRLGYTGVFGAEYKPATGSMDWMESVSHREGGFTG